MPTLRLNRPMRPVARIIARNPDALALIHNAKRQSRTLRYRDRSAHLGWRAVSPLVLTLDIALAYRLIDWSDVGPTDDPLVFVG